MGASESIADATVTVVIVNFRTPELTKRCLASLRGEREFLPKLRVMVVDGGSADGSAEELAKAVADPHYQGWASFLPLSINGGFGWANNQAILTLAQDSSAPEYLHLLNPDAEVTEGAVAQLVEELARHPRCAAAGSQLLAPLGERSASAFRFPSAQREFVNAAQSESLGRMLGIASTVVESAQSCEVDWVTGASVMLRTAALRETGLFDDGFFLYFEEVELMHRLRSAGWTVRHAPQSRVIHLEGAATGIEAAAARPMPAYWYRSRRRYFSLTEGRAAALLANLTWLTGRMLAARKLFLGKSLGASTGRARDLLRFGFLPRRSDSKRSVQAWGETPGRPPAWMTNP